MPLSGEDETAIDDAIQAWRQGDVVLDADLEFVHLADLTRPHSPASRSFAECLAGAGDPAPEGATAISDEPLGFAVLSQTCDIVRSCRDRPFVEVAPLVPVSANVVEEARRLKRSAFAYVPAVADRHLVADLDRVMTVEKAVVAGWARIAGIETDADRRAFAEALSRKRSRFAFPDDFLAAARPLLKRLARKHDKLDDEGAHLSALREIRVRAVPSWDDTSVQLSWWFIKENDPDGVAAVAWPDLADEWLALFDQTGRFRLEPPTVCRLGDMTAQDYIESDRLDLDSLSVPREA